MYPGMAPIRPIRALAVIVAAGVTRPVSSEQDGPDCAHIGLAYPSPPDSTRLPTMAADANGCQFQCHQQKSCRHFTFYKKSSHCWLFQDDQNPPTLQEAGAISGPAVCGKPDQTRAAATDVYLCGCRPPPCTNNGSLGTFFAAAGSTVGKVADGVKGSLGTIAGKVADGVKGSLGTIAGKVADGVKGISPHGPDPDTPSCANVGTALNDPDNNRVITGGTKKNAKECQEACKAAARDACLFFTFYTNTGGCWLQGAEAKAFSSKDAISGSWNCEDALPSPALDEDPVHSIESWPWVDAVVLGLCVAAVCGGAARLCKGDGKDGRTSRSLQLGCGDDDDEDESEPAKGGEGAPLMASPVVSRGPISYPQGSSFYMASPSPSFGTPSFGAAAGPVYAPMSQMVYATQADYMSQPQPVPTATSVSPIGSPRLYSYTPNSLSPQGPVTAWVTGEAMPQPTPTGQTTIAAPGQTTLPPLDLQQAKMRAEAEAQTAGASQPVQVAVEPVAGSPLAMEKTAPSSSPQITMQITPRMAAMAAALGDD
eukprot:TRINITY_DN6320_c0_g1_i4.p1 TRINITY_DN6320_c0_g1~~TRINITY_DN6320_c0_g1_i4.p1  ORF type:complete len:539 (-),score=84.13 TRINITY_DN6320_c0_g1_i4:122-1738(-)